MLVGKQTVLGLMLLVPDSTDTPRLEPETKVQALSCLGVIPVSGLTDLIHPAFQKWYTAGLYSF